MTTKTTAEVLIKIREILSYCSRAPGELHPQNQAQFMRAREGLALLDSVQAGEECKLPHWNLDDIANAIKKAQALGFGCEQPKPEVVTVEEFSKTYNVGTLFAKCLSDKYPNGLIIKGEKL